jgi:hypothetical protein
MSNIDWLPLLQKHGIEYAERGANVKRGEVAVRCPFCGSADPSKHMGIDVNTGRWACWRNKQEHSGKSPVRLLVKLLGVTYTQARDIAGLDDSYVDPDGFSALVEKLKYGNTKETELATLELDTTFSFILQDDHRTRLHWNYLFNLRGFNTPKQTNGITDVDKLVNDYGLRAGISGVWQNRIILPYYQDGKLVTWSGRTIGSHPIRYRDLEIKSSLCAPKHALYNYDNAIQGGRVLVLQEGPFDALKVDLYGKRCGVRSVALSTNSLSAKQSYLLSTLSEQYQRVHVVMDTKTELGWADSMRMKQSLANLPRVTFGLVPFNAGDGGNLTKQQVIAWCKDLTSERNYELKKDS